MSAVATTPTNADPAVAVREISHGFATPDGDYVSVLDNICFDVPEGQFVALVGPSGCGKTTVLNMAAGLIAPVCGEVRLNGEVVDGISRAVGYMFARDGLLPWRTALRNVEVGLEVRGVAHGHRRRRAAAMLELVGLGGFENMAPRQLSQGMRQRVAMARTLALDPEMLLMDEPFAALDAQTKLRLQGEFLRLWSDSGKTVMFVTHDLTEAVALADRVVVFTSRPGRIQADIAIDLPRPRDVEQVRFTDRYQELHATVWQALHDGSDRAAD